MAREGGNIAKGNGSSRDRLSVADGRCFYLPKWFSIGVLLISCAARETPVQSPASAPETPEQLTAKQLEAVISAGMPRIKQRCWQPALDARAPGQQPLARVFMSMTIDASGSVINVETKGEAPGFPGLSACIADAMRTWKFPRSAGSTTVNLPFEFRAV